MFKKAVLILILGILSIQVFPLNLVMDAPFDNEFEQKMAMNDPDDDVEDEFAKVIKDKVFNNIDAFISSETTYKRNMQYNILYVTELPILSSPVICPPPNFI